MAINKIDERLLEVLKFKGYKPSALSIETGMPYNRWNAFYYGKIRAGGDHIEAISELWPEFAYWVATGKTDPGAGHVSPEIERKREDSTAAGAG